MSLDDHYAKWHDGRYERHKFAVAGRTFGLDIDHGHAAGCGLPASPASVVWWEDNSRPDVLELRVKDRACLMIEEVTE